MKGSPMFAAVMAVLASLCVGEAEAQWSRSELQGRGVKLPRRWGLGVTYYQQDQPYGVDSLVLGIPGFPPGVADDLDVQNNTETTHAVLDYWILPFLDVHVIFGQIEGTTDVALSELSLGLPLGDITARYDGLVYGAGFTLAGGGERWFGSLTGQYTATDLNGENSSVEAWVASPRAGLVLGPTTVYVGAMYQRPEEKHSGIYEVPGLGTVPYEVTLGSTDDWSYLAGLTWSLTERFVLVVEGGFGVRESWLANLTYRW